MFSQESRRFQRSITRKLLLHVYQTTLSPSLALPCQAGFCSSTRVCVCDIQNVDSDAMRPTKHPYEQVVETGRRTQRGNPNKRSAIRGHGGANKKLSDDRDDDDDDDDDDDGVGRVYRQGWMKEA